MDNKIIGRFIPIDKFNYWAKPFFVLTREPSDYLAPAWKGISVDGEEYHVVESAWKFEPIEWDGEGLPPVGCECEYETKFDGWQPVRIELIKSEGIAFTWLSNSQAYNGLDCVGVQKSGSFRPIRSEADKKRDEAILQLSHSLRANGSVTEEQLCRLYSDIAAGYIPHIRID